MQGCAAVVCLIRLNSNVTTNRSDSAIDVNITIREQRKEKPDNLMRAKGAGYLCQEDGLVGSTSWHCRLIAWL